MITKKYPNVAVLLAAYNGAHFIKDQINSIIQQKKVRVSLFINIDKSNDETESIVDELIKKNKDIIKISKKVIFGSASKNFYDIFKEINFKNFDYISLSDQDDLWYENKLYNAIDKILENKSDGYSSNIYSKKINYSKKKLILKSQKKLNIMTG